eukprot:SAG31_NODE_3645_length_4030_cov_2.443653_1_plen_51_part_00
MWPCVNVWPGLWNEHSHPPVIAPAVVAVTDKWGIKPCAFAAWLCTPVPAR